MALTADQWEESVLLYTEHEWDVSELADHFGISRQAMARGLVRRGVAMRPTTPAAELRMKQCARCLHFLPAGMFSWSGTAAKRRLQSHCTNCTNQRDETPRWDIDSQPLEQALGAWFDQ